MAIEQNRSTMGKLQPISEQLAAMLPEDKANYRVPEGYLRAIHFRWGGRVDRALTGVDWV